MKKLKSKIVSLALAFCLIVPCMFMLTACGDDHTHDLTKVEAVEKTCTTDGNTAYYKCDCGKYFSDEEAKNEIAKDSWVIAKGHTFADTWTYNDTHHWKEATCSHSTEKGEYAEHSLTDNVCACGYVAITYTVANEDEWNEVFTGDYLTNGTVNIVDDTIINGEVDLDSRVTMEKKSTETSMKMAITDSEGEQILLLEKRDEKWYGVVEYQENVWYGMEQDPAEVESYTFAGCEGLAFVNKFEDFEYDEENHCYVANNFIIEEGVGDEPDQVADYVKVYIEDGKLAKMEMKMTISETSYNTTEYVFSDYGTTTIEVPSWTIPEL